MRIKSSQSYIFQKPISAYQILEKAAEILSERYIRTEAFSRPEATMDYLSCKLGGYDKEIFAVMMLDNQHQLIEFRELFFGTIDGASVYPREVVKAVLEVNASAVIFAHNHPSGNSEPSQADKAITKRLSDALGLIDVRVLDHIVVGETSTSFAERGLL